jgi:hypothetical protein
MKVLSASISAGHLNAGASCMLKMTTRVQEKTHSSTFRSRKDKRLSLNLDRGNADDARNSAKLALQTPETTGLALYFSAGCGQQTARREKSCEYSNDLQNNPFPRLLQLPGAAFPNA